LRTKVSRTRRRNGCALGACTRETGAPAEGSRRGTRARDPAAPRPRPAGACTGAGARARGGGRAAGVRPLPRTHVAPYRATGTIMAVGAKTARLVFVRTPRPCPRATPPRALPAPPHRSRATPRGLPSPPPPPRAPPPPPAPRAPRPPRRRSAAPPPRPPPPRPRPGSSRAAAPCRRRQQARASAAALPAGRVRGVA
jgi:hypothetical protein